MKQETVNVKKGGSFLIEETGYDQIFTPEDFTDEHKMIGKTTEDYVVNDVLPYIDEIENHQFEHSVRLLKKPEISASSEQTCLKSTAESAWIKSVQPSLRKSFHVPKQLFAILRRSRRYRFIADCVLRNGRTEKTYLPDLASGQRIAAYALTEPGSGSDALGAKTTAVLNEAGTHYILNGEKQWITNSAFADVFVVYAKVDGDKFSAFIVEKNYPGVSTGPEEKKWGLRVHRQER